MATSAKKEIFESFTDSEDEFIKRVLSKKPELKPTLTRPKEQEEWLLSCLFPSSVPSQVSKNKNLIEMSDDPVLEEFIKNYNS